MVLRCLFRRLVGELNFLGHPLASHHHSERVDDDSHAMLIALPERLDPYIGQHIADIAVISFGREEPLGRGVVDMNVTLDILYTGANSWRI